MKWRFCARVDDVMICSVCWVVKIIPARLFQNDPIGIMFRCEARVTKESVGLLKTPLNRGNYGLCPRLLLLLLEADLLFLKLLDDLALSAVVSDSLPFVVSLLF